MIPLQSYMSMFGEKDERQLSPWFLDIFFWCTDLKVAGDKGKWNERESLREYAEIEEFQFFKMNITWMEASAKTMIFLKWKQLLNSFHSSCHNHQRIWRLQKKRLILHKWKHELKHWSFEGEKRVLNLFHSSYCVYRGRNETKSTQHLQCSIYSKWARKDYWQPAHSRISVSLVFW